MNIRRSTTLCICLALLGPGLATAQQAKSITVEVCVKFELDFIDAAAGDWWTDNTPVLARGVGVDIEDDTQLRSFNLGERDGCLTVDVDVTAPLNRFTVTALSNARLNGIDLASHDSDTWDSKPTARNQWTVSTNDGSVTLLLPPEQVWMALAIGTWVFQRNDFHILQGTSRGCCLESSANYSPDGTCTAPDPAKEYSPIPPPVRFFTGSEACGGSAIDDSAGVEHPAVNVSCKRKWVLAHELGHVIAAMRMGGREGGDERPMTAFTNKCSADYNATDYEDGVMTLIDPGRGAESRGHFTKEYLSNAFREGWAEFVAIWTWNKRSESDCVIETIGYGDMDLDGSVDNDYSGFSNLIDKTHSCAGSPFFGGPFARDPGVTDGNNWLHDLEQEPSNSCKRAATEEKERNRSTIHDVARMFWDLTVKTGPYALDPAVLADLYVNMCPRGWAATDDEVEGVPGNWGDLPLERLWLSANHVDVNPEVEVTAHDHIVH